MYRKLGETIHDIYYIKWCSSDFVHQWYQHDLQSLSRTWSFQDHKMPQPRLEDQESESNEFPGCQSKKFLVQT